MGFQSIRIVPNKENCDVLKNVEQSLISGEGHNSGFSVETLIRLAKNGFFEKSGQLYEFLENSTIELVPTRADPRNPELEARVLKLKAEQENREYKRMVKGLECNQASKMTVRQDVRLVTSQVTAVINVVLTVVGTFFFTFKAVEYALPEKNITTQVLLGIVTSTAVALADLFFLARTI